MENTISFTYMPYIYIESYKNVLYNIRKYYPESDIFVYIDSDNSKLNVYLNIAQNNNCIFNVRNQKYGYINREDSIDVNLPKILESFCRTYNTCINTNSKWIMMVEDDVLIKRKIKQWPTTDCGTNREYFKIGGGAIFSRKKYIEAYEKLGVIGIENMVKNNHLLSWAGDELFKEMLLMVGCTHEKWIELAEPNYYDNIDHAVYHGYKDLHKLG
jgi:hypothetical protein